MDRLVSLTLTRCSLNDDGVIALARSPHFPRLARLELLGNDITDIGARALAESPTLAKLAFLGLKENPAITKEAKKLLRDRFGAGVVTFSR
jgi:hypothetical protein